MNQPQSIQFYWNHRFIEIDFNTPGAPRPSTTVLNWLRQQHTGKGTKEGCAEGDCGACTVVACWPDEMGKLRYHAVNSCLIFLPWLHGKHLITVEGLAENGVLHPVQQRVVDLHASQCGFCTPGIVMSLFALSKSGLAPSRKAAVTAMSGNLCRCTGYEPILEVAIKSMESGADDLFDTKEPEMIAQMHTLSPCPNRIDHREQIYFIPETVQEAINIRATEPEAQLFCGGTDTALAQTKKFIVQPMLLDVSRIDALRHYSADENGWFVGAALSLEEISRLHQGKIPLFDQLFEVFASKQIRELGTLGGNIGSASPIGDIWPVLMALDASVVLEGHMGQRNIEASAFITGYKTTQIKADEIITGVRIPKPEANRQFRFLKLSKRRQMDISTVSLALSIRSDASGTIQNAVIAFGGMADRPKRATAAEQLLKGHKPDEHITNKMCDALTIDFHPISDARASAEGRMVLAQNSLRKCLNSFNTNQTPFSHE